MRCPNSLCQKRECSGKFCQRCGWKVDQPQTGWQMIWWGFITFISLPFLVLSAASDNVG